MADRHALRAFCAPVRGTQPAWDAVPLLVVLLLVVLLLVVLPLAVLPLAGLPLAVLTHDMPPPGAELLCVQPPHGRHTQHVEMRTSTHENEYRYAYRHGAGRV